MSGTDSKSGRSRTGADFEIACSDLKFEAQIASPDPSVVTTLAKGDLLVLTVSSGAGTQSVQAYKDSTLVGSLLANLVARLRECMLAGTDYQATVLSVNGGQVKVFVEHA